MPVIAFVRSEQAGEQLQQSGFAGAVRAGQNADAGWNVEGKVVNARKSPKRFVSRRQQIMPQVYRLRNCYTQPKTRLEAKAICF
jgi:hypothetical protein